jgi:hypothetical protein
LQQQKVVKIILTKKKTPGPAHNTVKSGPKNTSKFFFKKKKKRDYDKERKALLSDTNPLNFKSNYVFYG